MPKRRVGLTASSVDTPRLCLGGYCGGLAGRVAMLATTLGLAMEKLVLLSCPVYRRYSPDFRCAKEVVSVRARLDLVILADGGGQRFRDSRIREYVLPVWFCTTSAYWPSPLQSRSLLNTVRPQPAIWKLARSGSVSVARAPTDGPRPRQWTAADLDLS